MAVLSTTTQTLTITNSTFSNNSAYYVGGIHNSAATLSVGNTVLKAGALEVNIVNTGTGSSQGYNLSSDDGGGYLTGPGDQINTEPLLGSLQDNGGPTLTHALLPGSPATDAGDPNFTPPPGARPAWLSARCELPHRHRLVRSPGWQHTYAHSYSDCDNNIYCNSNANSEGYTHA